MRWFFEDWDWDHAWAALVNLSGNTANCDVVVI